MLSYFSFSPSAFFSAHHFEHSLVNWRWFRVCRVHLQPLLTVHVRCGIRHTVSGVNDGYADIPGCKTRNWEEKEKRDDGEGGRDGKRALCKIDKSGSWLDTHEDARERTALALVNTASSFCIFLIHSF